MISSLKPIHFILSFLALTLVSCDISTTTNSNTGPNGPGDNNSEWLIPSNEVIDGGPGQDGIPSIDNPKFVNAFEATFVEDDRMVTGVKIGNEIRVYPHQIMDWHEIVNDSKDDQHFALTYCPLTGTAITFNREINNDINEFGTSGLLFRNNLIMYDRNTNSRWSQMQMRAVNGSLIGEEGELIQTIQTTWSTWKELFFDSRVLSTNTGFNRNYQGFAYGPNYSTDDRLFIFEPRRTDSRLPNKALVHAVFPDDFEGESTVPRIYSIEDTSSEIEVVQERFDGRDIVFVGSSELNFGVTFESTLPSGMELTFEPVQGELPVVMEDQQGTKWTIFGDAVSGPRDGEQLTPTNSYNGYWFAFANFYPDSCLYPEEC